MWTSRTAFENDACPVGDELLGSLYRASEHGLSELVESVSPDVRAMLALFCYRRNHLHSMGVAIAATCTQRDLVEQGGVVGSTLFAMSREAPSATPSVSAYGKCTITLSTKPLSTFADVEDDMDDEPAQMTA